MLGDLHIHSKYSLNATHPNTKPSYLSELKDIFKVAQKKNISVLAITDHDNVKGGLTALKEVKKFPNITIIPGIEVSSKNGHILALNVKENIKRNLSAEETIDKIIALGGYPVIAHPFDIALSLTKKNILSLDPKKFGMEIFNSRSILGYKKRKEFILKNKFPFTAGSDAHVPKNVGNANVKFDTTSTKVDDLIEDIKKRKISYFGKRSSLIKAGLNEIHTFF